ncbi:MAG: HEAT repeat domain-containing protein [Kofleriaceae bacterium]
MIPRALLIISLLLGVGCEKTNHENIDKWTRTEKGPGKLEKALKDEGLDADLSAHAAANMIRMGNDPAVRAAFDSMSEARRIAVLQKLAPRLWDLARIDKEDALPASQQIVAKDSLINLRKHGDAALKQQIDNYLIDWYAVMSYEGRAKVGSTLGAAALRLIGPAAGKKMISVLNGVVAAPGQETTKIRIGDELLLGLAATSDPDAVKYVIDVAGMDRGDPTLAKRAMNALRTAYVDPGGRFDVADPAGLRPNLDALVKVAKDERMMGQPGNDAMELIRAVGAPACQEPLISLIALPHPEKNFRYAAAYNAIGCGGVSAVVPAVRALPEAPYGQKELDGAVISEIVKLTPRDKVLAALRELLADKSWVSRWVAIEALAKMKSVEDAPKIAALSGSKDKLVGYWGDQSAVEPKDRKTDPTLGQRAKELADGLAAAPK